jgi:NitT/TauT family transport system permease protein
MPESTQRPDRVFEVETDRLDVIERPRTFWRAVYARGWIRKSLLLIVLALAWELFARFHDQPLQVPTFLATVEALFAALASGELPRAAGYTLPILLVGYLSGLLLAGLLTALASFTRIGADLLETLTAMFNPLPSIALLPLALIWFGLGSGCRANPRCGSPGNGGASTVSDEQ